MVLIDFVAMPLFQKFLSPIIIPISAVFVYQSICPILIVPIEILLK